MLRREHLLSSLIDISVESLDPKVGAGKSNLRGAALCCDRQRSICLAADGHVEDREVSGTTELDLMDAIKARWTEIALQRDPAGMGDRGTSATVAPTKVALQLAPLARSTPLRAVLAPIQSVSIALGLSATVNHGSLVISSS